MEQLFEEANYVIRYEKGNFNSGYCVLDDRRIAVINKFLDMEARINVLVEILPTIDIQEDTLSTEMQKWYKQLQSMKPAKTDNSEPTETNEE